MFDILQSISGLNFQNYDKNLVFMFVAFVTFLVLDICYTILLKFVDKILNKRR